MSVSRRTLSNPCAVDNIRPELIKVTDQSIDLNAQLSYFLLRSPINIIAIFATQPEIWYDGSTYSGQVRDQTGISTKAGLAEYAC